MAREVMERHAADNVIDPGTVPGVNVGRGGDV